ncbi:arylamine N-acetyltransferase 2 [Cucurbitaria berberidis CBS 394.84]|uniref:Arylamine N-acetyltransferase 2 n=1 Tax=Cucurbitaria berberidis CBS 394.84 TaxID=1168544 RepID=A0A9P4LB10_9PLEO|nr:arylamine N-acetyltransferase 2 [Cucurbitaria berberidis CBS 394.84]KAF1849036.1 arylamine N-acetyltransferase 2 [Cucurbitaria berberidis CBS 394.84]
MAIPSVFSENQLSTFLKYVGLPLSLQQQRCSGDASKDLHFLTRLHTHMISTVPYENLWLHYNPKHTNTIRPQDTYSNVVINNRGRGGYCFQVSIFFNHILRGLGFQAYLTAVRIRLRVDGIPQGDYGGWRHLVNIITLSDGTRWSMDVGFGGDGPTAPIQLIHNHPQKNLGSQEIRLWHDWIPMQLLRTTETKLWIYQFRNSAQKEWNSFYAFSSEAEAMEADFHNLNWYTGAHPESFQTYTCLVVKFLRRLKEGSADGNEADEKIYGKRMLVNGVVKENLGGRTRVVEDCKTEQQRLVAMQKWFGMTFTEEEQSGIRDWGTELRGEGSEDIIEKLGKRGDIWEAQRGEGWQWNWKGPAVEG